MARIGYARVSTADQDLGIQKERLAAAGCAPIRAEKVSGKSLEGRDELAAILEFVRDGDELVVHRLDRLARSTRDALNIVHALEAKGATLRILEPDISTAGPCGPVMITVLGMVAEMERRFIKERQREGIDKAKALGVYKGREKAISPERIKELRLTGLGASAIARQLGCSRMTVYRELKALQASAEIAIT